jgi:hypothetical protein
MHKGIGSGYHDPVVVDDFPEADARQFFQQQGNVPSMTDADWSTVYEVLPLVR